MERDAYTAVSIHKDRIKQLDAVEPYIDGPRTISGTGGVTPAQYLEQAYEIFGLPSPDALLTDILAVLVHEEETLPKDDDIRKESRQGDGDFEIQAKLFLDALRTGLKTSEFREAGKQVSILTTKLSKSALFSKEAGMRISPVGMIDELVIIDVLLSIARSCFPLPAAQTTFLYLISSAVSDIQSFSFAAAAQVELGRGRLREASFLAARAKSFRSSLSISNLQYEIRQAAAQKESSMDAGKCFDDLGDRFCRLPFTALTVDAYDFNTKKTTYQACTCAANSPVKFTTDEEPWNHAVFRKFRESILDGSFKFCAKSTCPEIVNNRLPKKDALQNEYLLKVIRENRTTLDKGPSDIKLLYDYHCNLRCPSCRPSFIHNSPEQIELLDAFAEGKLLPLIANNVKTLMMSGRGEALSSPHSLNLLRKLTPGTNPNLSIIIRSNGSNITKEKWDSLGESNKLLKTFVVSIDGVERDTFEKLRYPAKWEKVNHSMDFLGNLRRSGQIQRLDVDFVMQAENYKQIRSLLLRCVAWHVDVLFAMRIRNSRRFPGDEFSQTLDICDPSNPRHEDFKKEMALFWQEYEALKKSKNENTKIESHLPRVIFADF